MSYLGTGAHHLTASPRLLSHRRCRHGPHRLYSSALPRDGLAAFSPACSANGASLALCANAVASVPQRERELGRMRPLYDYSYRPPGLIYPRPCHIHPHWIRGSVVHPRVHHARHAAPPGNFDVAMRCPSGVGRKLDPVLHTSAHAPQPPGRERCARPGASRPLLARALRETGRPRAPGQVHLGALAQ